MEKTIKINYVTIPIFVSSIGFFVSQTNKSTFIRYSILIFS